MNGKINPIQVQKFLKGISYPTTKEEVVNKAKENGADQSIISGLESITTERFDSPRDIAKAVGEYNKGM